MHLYRSYAGLSIGLQRTYIVQVSCGTMRALYMKLHRAGLKQSCVGENQAEFLTCVAALQRCHGVRIVTTAANIRGLCHVL